ncbi:MAG: DUF3598 family protein [Synechococcaceae cyanobacterium]|nr:DUF3598 family protein [Synechococcaceae cyanobacterium]
MASQWQNFLCNLGEWRGSFASLSPDGSVRDSTPSILSLERDAEEERLVRFRLRRFGPEGLSGEPTRDLQQDYRSLGRQVVFFANGSFCKGSLQVAPNTAFGAEFGFIDRDRRHRLVLLYDTAGAFDHPVLIREFRAGHEVPEQPPLTPDGLLGQWQGEMATISADWPEPDLEAVQVSYGPADLSGLQLLPDGGYYRLPTQVSHRQAFVIEAGWQPAPGRMQRLIRRYDASGAWQSASLQSLQAC